MSEGIRTLLSFGGGSIGICTIVIAFGVGIGQIPSPEVVASNVSKIEKVKEEVSKTGTNVAVMEEKIRNIELTVKRIETTQTAQFKSVMEKLDKLDRRR